MQLSHVDKLTLIFICIFVTYLIRVYNPNISSSIVFGSFIFLLVLSIQLPYSLYSFVF